MHSRSLYVLVLLLALVAASCSSSEGASTGESADASSEANESQDEAGADGEATEDASTDAADQDGDQASTSTGADLASSVADEDSPLAALLGFDGFEDPAFLVEQQRRVDERIQTCMLDQGFEYTPQNLDDENLAFGRSLAPGLSDEEFAAQYGYGIAASGENLINLVNASIDDPNNARLAEMSDAESLAWQQAMLGSNIDIDPDTGELIDPETGEVINPLEAMMVGDGCATRANQEVFGSLQAIFLLESQFAELEDRFQSDPRIVGFTADWSTCLAEAGFDYAEIGDPELDFDERLNAIIAPLLAQAGGVPGADVDPIVLSPDQQAAVDQLQVDEIAVAVADQACLAPFRDEAEAIEREFELEFIEQNADVLADVAG